MNEPAWTLRAMRLDGERVIVTLDSPTGAPRDFAFVADEEDGLVEVWSDELAGFLGDGEARPLFAAVHRFFIATRVPIRPEPS